MGKGKKEAGQARYSSRPKCKTGRELGRGSPWRRVWQDREQNDVAGLEVKQC